MENVIEGINVLEQIPIKDLTILSMILIGLGIGIAIIDAVIFFIVTKYKKIYFRDAESKIFLFWYVLGIGLAIFSTAPLPCFYTETGRYTYKCTFNDSVSANYISENFDIVSNKDNIWTIKDKQ